MRHFHFRRGRIICKNSHELDTMSVHVLVIALSSFKTHRFSIRNYRTKHSDDYSQFRLFVISSFWRRRRFDRVKVLDIQNREAHFDIEALIC